jgi:predicted nucleotidyltransferase
MHTTVALQPATKEKLAALKRRWKLRSLEEVVEQLLAGPPKTAEQLFKAHKSAVMEVLKKRGITRLVAFGSRARGDARPDSDLDLMVRLPAGASLFDQAGAMLDLEKVFAMKVDLVEEGPHLGRLNARIRDEGVVLVG